MCAVTARVPAVAVVPGGPPRGGTIPAPRDEVEKYYEFLRKHGAKLLRSRSEAAKGAKHEQDEKESRKAAEYAEEPAEYNYTVGRCRILPLDGDKTFVKDTLSICPQQHSIGTAGGVPRGTTVPSGPTINTGIKGPQTIGRGKGGKDMPRDILKKHSHK